MIKHPQARIIGTGSYLPSKILTNQELEKIVETSDEWIFSRTGMKERRIAEKDEFTSSMATKAAHKALESAHLNPEDIDLILVATLTPDYIFPSTACLVQAELKATKAAALDIQAACTGFIYALATAKAFIESGVYKNVLIIASEKLSSITDYTDRSTCILFGDGASAAVVSSQGKGLFVSQAVLGADGNLAELLFMPGGGSRIPASEESVKSRQHFIKMNGNEVFKHAVRRMESAAVECLEKESLKEEDVHYLIPHQANIRIIEALAKRFKLPMERVFTTVHKYGNTSASSCGIALDEFLRHQHPEIGQHLLLVAFGAGLTWGSSVLTYKEG